MDEKIMVEFNQYEFNKILEYQRETNSDNIQEAIVKAICMAHYGIDFIKRSELKC